MCVDTKNKRCWCCSLTSATYGLAIVQVLYIIMFVSFSDYISLSLSIVNLLAFGLFIWDKHNPVYRQILFYLSVVVFVLIFINMTVLFILGMFYNNWAREKLEGGCDYTKVNY